MGNCDMFCCSFLILLVGFTLFMLGGLIYIKYFVKDKEETLNNNCTHCNGIGWINYFGEKDICHNCKPPTKEGE